MGDSIRAKNFLLGIGTDLLVHISGVETRLRSSLVGMKPDEYLVIEAPKVGGIEATLFDGNKITVIFMLAGTVYGFESFILNTVSHPSRLIFISFPDTVASHELRESHRVNCYLPAVINLDGDDTAYDGVILDISRLGCSFNAVSVPTAATHLFQLGGKVNLTFELPGMEGNSRFSGKIKNLNLDERIISVGVRFVGIDQEVQGKIDAYVHSVSELCSM